MTYTSTPVAAADTEKHASLLVSTLAGRAPRAALGLAASQFAWPHLKRLRDAARTRTTYTVKVLGTDEIYDDLHEWVLSLLPAHEQHALIAWTSNRDAVVYSPDGAPSTSPRVRLRYDGSRQQVIKIAGHKVQVVVSDESGDKEKYFKPPELIFTARSLAGQHQLLAEIARVVERNHQDKRKPSFRMLTKWGEWQKLDNLPPRTIDSVVLAPGQIERLTADVAKFLGAEADYARRSVPWHRGHLYYGPPGTGKTSVARAVATHFGLDMWFMPLADLQRDCDLLSAVSRIGPRSMLLLEDVDVFHAARKREDGDGVTLSGLLNALDGILTPNGLLKVLTTNNRDVLDDAVIRAGRVDLTEGFQYADTEQVSRLVSRWYDQTIIIDGHYSVSPAEVVEVCKQYDDPEECVIALKELGYGS